MKLAPPTLRARILMCAVILVALTLGGALVTVFAIHRIHGLLAAVVDGDVAALEVAQELESSLTTQKGLLTYYFLDGDSTWLRSIEEHNARFEEWLKRARETATNGAQRDILNEVDSRYIRYCHARDEVIERYSGGDREGGFVLHKGLRQQFSAIHELCVRYKDLHKASIASARTDLANEVRSLRLLSVMGMVAALGLGGLLVYILIYQVLGPLRRMALETDPSIKAGRVDDEVKAIGQRVRSLIEDVDQTQTELQQSREHLVQSEKLAMVGKLAAGVAHSIRNPLTSVKMRLFSLSRSLQLSPSEKEDMDVISDEIRHLDTIVRNFLEFSRRPKLKIQTVSPSDVVDLAIQLLRHRLESYGVEVELYRQRRLPDIEADPEQLKEVLVNLIVNACDATGEGGKIVIQEEEGKTDPMGHVVVIRVSDNGPGVPEGIKDKIFQPFFSTKEEGTGLGLSIAERIIEDHSGCLSLRSREGKGASFIITLPCKAEGAWLRS
ncbi:MAG: sensor histidine kinase [Syntrophobacteraceae bacterium]